MIDLRDTDIKLSLVNKNFATQIYFNSAISFSLLAWWNFPYKTSRDLSPSRDTSNQRRNWKEGTKKQFSQCNFIVCCVFYSQKKTTQN